MWLPPKASRHTLQSSKRSVRRTLSEEVLFQLGRESEPGSSVSPARLVMAVYAERSGQEMGPQCWSGEVYLYHCHSVTMRGSELFRFVPGLPPCGRNGTARWTCVNVDNRRYAVHRVAAETVQETEQDRPSASSFSSSFSSSSSSHFLCAPTVLPIDSQGRRDDSDLCYWS